MYNHFIGLGLENSSKNYDKPLDGEHFVYGSMGGYYTLDELYQQYGKMKELFPQYLKKIDTIGFTSEKRPIIAYCFGDCTSNGFPEALFTALHHAREPEGYMATAYFFWNLMEKADAETQQPFICLTIAQLILFRLLILTG